MSINQGKLLVYQTNDIEELKKTKGLMEQMLNLTTKLQNDIKQYHKTHNVVCQRFALPEVRIIYF